MSVDFANHITLPTEPSKNTARRKTIMGRLSHFDEEKSPDANASFVMWDSPKSQSKKKLDFIDTK